MDSSKQKKVKIFGVPIDLGSRPMGVEMGPMAIRYAGLAEALHFNEIEYVDHGNLRVDRQNCQRDSLKEIARVSNELAELVRDSVESGYIPIVLGGDHSASIGSIAGASKASQRLGLIWLDCHPDANTPETSPSGNVHGMTVAISLGYGPPELVQCSGSSPKVLPEDVCIIGAKDIDPGERKLLDDLGVRMYTLFDIQRLGIVQVMEEAIGIVTKKTDRVYVSFDLDVLDPLIAPGTGILSRGGLSYREISYIMQSLGQRDLIGSIDLIEVNPLLDIRNQTSELAVELLLSALGRSYGDYERYYLTQGSILSNEAANGVRKRL